MIGSLLSFSTFLLSLHSRYKPSLYPLNYTRKTSNIVDYLLLKLDVYNPLNKINSITFLILSSFFLGEIYIVFGTAMEKVRHRLKNFLFFHAALKVSLMIVV